MPPPRSAAQPQPGSQGTRFANGRQVLESFKSVHLEAVLVLVETGAIPPAPAACLRDATEFVGKLEY